MVRLYPGEALTIQLDQSTWRPLNSYLRMHPLWTSVCEFPVTGICWLSFFLPLVKGSQFLLPFCVCLLHQGVLEQHYALNSSCVLSEGSYIRPNCRICCQHAPVVWSIPGPLSTLTQARHSQCLGKSREKMGCRYMGQLFPSPRERMKSGIFHPLALC